MNAQLKDDNAARAPIEVKKPVYIRAVGAPVSRHDRDYIRRRLARRMRKFDEVVERTSVRIEDINGPRGGVDKRCRIKVVLSGFPSVVVEEQHYSPKAAIDGALDRAERTVWRTVQRGRTKA
ncbi:MAG TPA: HPF/RaiA family ribosome-associated protein [Gammaproteobacteria bacterium]|nr:HPF/RaiA family ribosome-associated protein [Gammaproteobacteria bacterium]